METLEELRQFHIEEGKPTGNALKQAKYSEFKKKLKELLSFIGELKGRKEISVYIDAMMKGITETPDCVVCGNKITTAQSRSLPKTCSRKCNGIHASRVILEQNGCYNLEREDVKEKIKETNRERYGSDHHMKSEKGKEQYRQSLKAKYGVINNFQRDDVKDRISETNVRKYGTRSVMQNPEIKKKAIQTLVERTGHDNPLKDPKVVEKIRKTNQERYGVDWYTKSDEYRNKMRTLALTEKPTHGRRSHIKQEVIDILRDKETMESLYEEYGGVVLSEILNVHNTTVYDWLKVHGIDTVNYSFLEKSVVEFIESLGVDVLRNDRTVLNGREIDILIPSMGIGFEVNGIWWHSSAYLDKNFHKEKTEECEKKGVTLYHIFEDEWWLRTEQVKRKIKHILKRSDEKPVYARKTKFEVVENRSLKFFFEDNHIQGHGKGSIGCVLKDKTGKIVAGAAFMKNPSDSSSMVLNRYATSCRVIGGLGKILANVQPLLAEMGITRLVSYADLRWSTGELYERTGWTLDKVIPPDYAYVVGNKRIRKQNFRKSIMKEKYPEYDENLTEWQNTEKLGIPRIYDCGLKRYSMELV